MDSELTEALKYSGIIILALFIISVIFVLAIGSLHRIIAFKGKHKLFKCRGSRQPERKDFERDVLIAAAIEAYLHAEQERKR